jgi:NAD(P)-dependent dehydrogenase (short-subunit alcohol dehydrogenase family)
MVADVADWDQQVRVFRAAVVKYGRVDYVFANAGIGERVWLPSAVATEEDFVRPDLRVSK